MPRLPVLSRLPQLVCAASLVVATLPALAQSPDALRGQRLYEASCLTCHAESVHDRGKKAARSIAEIREYVTRWAQVVNAPWTRSEIDDVATYLNERYYKYVCPPGATCRDQRAGAPRLRPSG